MEISFNLPHVFNARSSTSENEQVLGVLSETIRNIRANTAWDSATRPRLTRADGPYWTFQLPNVFKPGVDPVDNAYALKALLDGLSEINSIYLKNHTAPKLYDSGVRYGRTELWEPIPALYERGYGDCKSLTAAMVAERQLRNRPAKPVFRYNPRKDRTGTDYHILVVTENGYEDPSKVLGMGSNENAWFRH